MIVAFPVPNSKEIKSRTQIFATLKFFPDLFEKIPSFVCLLFKTENK